MADQDVAGSWCDGSSGSREFVWGGWGGGQGRNSQRAWVFLGLLLAAVAVLLALHSTSLAQCCDAALYQEEVLNLRSLSIPDSFGTNHNYGYAGWLAMLQTLGLGSRVGVAFAQLALLFASLGLMASIDRDRPFRFLALLMLVVGIPVAWAYSGYTLTEAVVAPLTVLLLAGLWVLTRAESYRRAVLVSGANGLIAGLLWAARPGLLWVPFLLIVLCPLIYFAGHAVRLRTAVFAAGLGVIAAVSAALTTIPQFVFARRLGVSAYEGVFHLGLLDMQRTISPTLWRYATNLSGCGERDLFFSPRFENRSEISAIVKAGVSGSERVLASFAHVITALDPLPSPTYAASLRLNGFVILTLLSGFLLVPTVWALLISPRRLVRTAGQPAVAMYAWSIVAILALVSVIPTAAEYRFGVVGVTAMGCVAALGASSTWRPSFRTWFIGGILISGVVLAFGMWTLQQSEVWRACAL